MTIEMLSVMLRCTQTGVSHWNDKILVTTLFARLIDIEKVISKKNSVTVGDQPIKIKIP